MFLIESVSNSQTQIIGNIIKLYCSGGIELDPTYSKGVFYKNIPQPKLKFDIKPQIAGVIECDCRRLPLESNSIKSIMFDPPFVGGSQKDAPLGKIKARFGYFKNILELWKFYRESLDEFNRLLIDNGILIFKCQDTIESGKQYLSHVEIVNYSVAIGFYPIDLFILHTKNYLISPNMYNQQHCRKTHSYFLVFKKTISKVKYT
jgi:tRNA G10  N-methylase Trm11